MSSNLEPIRELAGSGGLAGTLQSGHEDDGRRLRGELHTSRVFAAKDDDEFVAQDLNDLLSGRERGHHVLTDSFGANEVDEFFDDFEVDVGFEQSGVRISCAGPRRCSPR